MARCRFDDVARALARHVKLSKTPTHRQLVRAMPPKPRQISSSDVFDGCNRKPSPTASKTVPETEDINNKVFVFGIIGLKAPVIYPLPSHLHACSRTSILPASIHHSL